MFYWNNYEAESVNYKDGSDDYANKGFTIGFYHIISGKSIYFKAFMTAFNETFNSNWSEESVFGRADPIYTFRQTTRKITIAFKIPASSMSEAYENLAKTQALTQFLYPAYTEINTANTIAQSPLVRIKFLNLLQSTPAQSDASAGKNEIYSGYAAAAGAENGLLGKIDSLTINHNLDSDIGVLEKSTGENAGATILPKMIDVNLGFSPIHENPLGWYESESESNTDPFDPNRGLGITTTNIAFGNPGVSFPYGATLSADTTTTPQAGVSPDNPVEPDQSTALAAKATGNNGE